MSFVAAARAILRQRMVPMTSRELADLAISRGLVSSEGKTPTATMAAQLYTYVLHNPTGDLRKLSEKGKGRAKRGSVRWEYVDRPKVGK